MALPEMSSEVSLKIVSNESSPFHYVDQYQFVCECVSVCACIHTNAIARITTAATELYSHHLNSRHLQPRPRPSSKGLRSFLSFMSATDTVSSTCGRILEDACLVNQAMLYFFSKIPYARYSDHTHAFILFQFSLSP